MRENHTLNGPGEQSTFPGYPDVFDPFNSWGMDRRQLRQLGQEWVTLIDAAYSPSRIFPDHADALPDIPEHGPGAAEAPHLWTRLLNEATQLAAPGMSGHMDTAPHPIAVMTQGLLAALNNNMLFHELSPFASRVEEALIDFFRSRLELGSDWDGTFASGGSMANLTALFAAVGGFSNTGSREDVYLLLPESGHLSLQKAGQVLGIPPEQILRLPCDQAGRIETTGLSETLARLPAKARPIVTCVIGTTIHGSVDELQAIADICEARDAWLHVDLIYGAALAFSRTHRHFLDGIARADSVVLGPQKWMYVPRVSAIVLIKGKECFNETLGVSLPYSLSGEAHRGGWGLQGSRPADAVTLWVLLQSMGSGFIGDLVDRNIALTQVFHDLLRDSPLLEPTHQPDLNLQTFRLRDPGSTPSDLPALHRNLTEQQQCWFSLSQWRGEPLLRAVLLSPRLNQQSLINFMTDLDQAAGMKGLST